MNTQYDTPPDGDFARYVEQLTAAAARDVARGDEVSFGKSRQQVASTGAQSPAAARPATPGVPGLQGGPGSVSKKPAGSAGKNLFAGMSFISHLRWVVVAWVLTQVLGEFVPGAGFLFVPVLIGYAVWVFGKANRNSSGELFKRVQVMAETTGQRAAQELRKQAERNRK